MVRFSFVVPSFFFVALLSSATESLPLQMTSVEVRPEVGHQANVRWTSKKPRPEDSAKRRTVNSAITLQAVGSNSQVTGGLNFNGLGVSEIGRAHV